MASRRLLQHIIRMERVHLKNLRMWSVMDVFLGIPKVRYTVNSQPEGERSTHSEGLDQREEILLKRDFFGVELLTSVEELFLARVHLGHKTGAWTPYMKEHILGTRAGVHIIDLDRTLHHLTTALNVAAHIAYRDGVILFVNERPQFDLITQRAARECQQYFVTGKWRPGTLTNSSKLLDTTRIPDLVLFFSVPPSRTAIKEALMSCVPSVGIVDTDCNPKYLTYPVPGNDDTPSAVELYLNLFSKAISIAQQKKIKQDEHKVLGDKSLQAHCNPDNDTAIRGNSWV